MKIMSFVFGLAAVAASATLPAATVSVSSFKGTVYGPGEATLAFTGVNAAQELWVAWDDADKGAASACRTSCVPPIAFASA